MPVRLARHAMATRFEILLPGEDAVRLRAAGEEALDEIDRIEAQLSLYRPTSEIAAVNQRAAREPVRVSPEVFAVLQQAQVLAEQTLGAFDITVAPLVKCWGFIGGSGNMPDADALARARECVGHGLVELDAKASSVCFRKAGVMLDLGAIGKGYAIDRAAEILREAGVASALLHGGTSTVYALGHPPEQDFWRVSIEAGEAAETERAAENEELCSKRMRIDLRDESISVSGVHGKSFKAEGKTLGHIIDPRTGMPSSEGLRAIIVLPSAMQTDALSTALLVSGEEGFARLCGLRPGMRALLETQHCGILRLHTSGIKADPGGDQKL